MTIYECDRCGRQSKPNDRLFLENTCVDVKGSYTSAAQDNPALRLFHFHEHWCEDCRRELVAKMRTTYEKFMERKARR